MPIWPIEEFIDGSWNFCAIACELQFPIAFEIRKRLTLYLPLHALDCFDEVANGVSHLTFHQNTRTADCSMFLRSIGCKLSRVVTSTSTPNASSRNSFMPARSTKENFFLGS